MHVLPLLLRHPYYASPRPPIDPNDKQPSEALLYLQINKPARILLGTNYDPASLHQDSTIPKPKNNDLINPEMKIKPCYDLPFVFNRRKNDPASFQSQDSSDRCLGMDVLQAFAVSTGLKCYLGSCSDTAGMHFYHAPNLTTLGLGFVYVT